MTLRAVAKVFFPVTPSSSAASYPANGNGAAKVEGYKEEGGDFFSGQTGNVGIYTANGRFFGAASAARWIRCSCWYRRPVVNTMTQISENCFAVPEYPSLSKSAQCQRRQRRRKKETKKRTERFEQKRTLSGKIIF